MGAEGISREKHGWIFFKKEVKSRLDIKSEHFASEERELETQLLREGEINRGNSCFVDTASHHGNRLCVLFSQLFKFGLRGRFQLIIIRLHLGLSTLEPRSHQILKQRNCNRHKI